MTIQLPDKVKKIISKIQAAGYEAYAVGGCIRDSLLNREPDDWDITTSAKPEEIKSIFSHTVDTGILHGTVTVLMDGGCFEVTTYRIDGEYEDNRHPKDVKFTASLTEDLKRRDFTINAMAYNNEVGLIDIFGGQEDLKKNVIRCVGEPEERFKEDALRIMRAIRFSAQLGYRIEEHTGAAIRTLAGSLVNISAERIQVELVKLVVSPHPEYIKVAYDMGVTKVIFPEWNQMMETKQQNPHHMYNVGEHTLKAMTLIESDKVLRLTMLLHDIGKPDTITLGKDGFHHFYGHGEKGSQIARQILRRLKFDNETIHKVTALVLHHDYGSSMMPDEQMVRKAANKIGKDILPLLFLVRRADIGAQSEYQRAKKLKILEAWEDGYDRMLQRKECVSLKDMAVTGKDLIACGMAPGKELGVTLQNLLKVVLENPEYNTKEYLLSLIK